MDLAERKPLEAELASEEAEGGGDADALALYLAEVARIPLLSAEEERDLALRMRNGDLRARERLIVSHLRLVVSVAREYGEVGLDLLDLIQEGNLGLMEAVDRFDVSRGVRLSAYARWWIRQAMGAALERQAQLIRIPAHLFRAIVRFQRLKTAFGGEEAEEWTDVLRAPGMTAERLEHLERTVAEVISLDAPLTEDEEMDTLDEIIADETVLPPERAALEILLREELTAIVNQLPERDAQVLRWRFGLEGATPLTLAEVGAALGVSRERARQLEERALKRLKEVWGEKALQYYRRLIAAV
ncbi:MAG: RNA polymerase sigma factor RpoD/SigA [Candidatus Bipolaricaulota bacterium]|nr:RNA polymerase sigma factor RpoD/SigA [Candidatus Bipolaricaulota bacterium]